MNLRQWLAVTLLTAAPLAIADETAGPSTRPGAPGRNMAARQLASAFPVLVRVEVTYRGYTLVGTGFGTNVSAVQVFENSRQVPPSAIVSVRNSRILVDRQPSGTIQHRVVVLGHSSQVITVDYPVPSQPGQVECPSYGGNVCNNRGTCNTISGRCACNTGFAGPACQHGDTIACNGHGTVSAAGACACNAGFTGAACQACAADYHAYPVCRYCNAARTCGGNGTCTNTGECSCNAGFTGKFCESRAAP